MILDVASLCVTLPMPGRVSRPGTFSPRSNQGFFPNGACFMGLFDLFTNGTATATGGLMDRLSHENGWTPDLRQGSAIAHYFKGDAITPRRDVIIVHPPDHFFATFSCTCRAKFAARSMTTPQLALFLARNDESVFGKWQITIEDGQVSAALRYTALTGGLSAEVFKAICVSLLAEVAFVEEALHGQGML